MAKNYRKKPVIIEAVQYTENNLDEILDFVGESAYYDPTMGLTIHTLEGPHYSRPGDFIIRGVKGEFYPCKPDIFEQTYEEI